MKSSATLFVRAASRRSQINVEVITPLSAHDIINIASYVVSTTTYYGG